MLAILKRITISAVTLLLLGCGTSRPAFDEAANELAAHVDPALRAGLGSTTVKPEKIAGIDYCSDPFFGPRQGARPTLTYTIPITALTEDPTSFVLKAEKVWQTQGLLIETEETDRVFARFASDDDYHLEASVSYANGEASIGGSGPCVDDPEAD